MVLDQDQDQSNHRIELACLVGNRESVFEQSVIGAKERH
jgi:hypothetical protein